MDEDGKVGLGIDEVFDILPIYGSLEPGQSVKTNITFYGHPFIKAECKGIRFFLLMVLLRKILRGFYVQLKLRHRHIK